MRETVNRIMLLSQSQMIGKNIISMTFAIASNKETKQSHRKIAALPLFGRSM